MGRSQPMCVVRDAWTLRRTHMERGETLAPPPLSMVGLNGPLLELAGDTILISIQRTPITRFTSV